MKKLAPLFLCVALFAAKGEGDLTTFFPKFASLLRVADHQTLISENLIYFPLRLKGMLDDSPEISIGATRFPGVLEKIAKGLSGMNMKNPHETEADFIAAQVKRGRFPQEAGENTARSGNLVFGKKGGVWKLVQVYVSDDLITELTRQNK